MSDRTIITRVRGRDCVVEPSTGRWFVGDSASAAASVAWDAVAEMLPEPASTGLDEVWIYTNDDCNLACAHCFMGDATASRPSSRPALDSLTRTVDEAVELGARVVYFTGGEPFARPDFPELLAYAAARADVAVLTNATLIDERMLARLLGAGFEQFASRVSFQVSIDGPRNVHEAVRGPASFERAVRGVELLRDLGSRPALVTTLSAQAAPHAEQVTQLAADLGLRVHHLLLPHRDGRMECADGVRAASPEQIIHAIRACRDIAEKTGITLSNDSVIASRVRRPGRRYDGCTGGARMLAVAADGIVYPCPTLVGTRALGAEVPSLADAMSAANLSAFASTSLCDRTKCVSCEVRYLCGGGCPAHAWRAGDGAEAEPYCEVYRALVTDHIAREAERLLAHDPDAAVLAPQPAADSLPVRHRFACT